MSPSPVETWMRQLPSIRDCWNFLWSILRCRVTPTVSCGIFFSTWGDGSSLAFFYLQGIGEPKDYPTAISTDLGLPIWVNHVAFRADQARYDQVKETMTAQLIKPVMEADHGWCRSVYYADPNGILIEFCVDSPGFKPDPKAAMDLLHAVPEGYTK